MTTIKLKTNDYGLQVLTVNGKVAAYNGRITEIVYNEAALHWVGIASGHRFVIAGGRKSGGAVNEWFVQYDALSPEHTFKVKSAVAACELIEKS